MSAGGAGTGGSISMLDDMQPFGGLDEHARATLAALRETFPFDCWTISRLIDGALVAQYVEPETEPLTSYAWLDTICAQMVELKGPCIVPSVAAVEAYAATRQCRERGIGAYAGAPLYEANGRLWGALCATHPTPLATDPIVDEGFLRWIARSMSTRLGLSTAPAQRDPTRLTRVPPVLDLDLWRTVLEKEHERALRTGATACVIEVDIDVEVEVEVDRGAQLLAIGARGCDYVARTGPRSVGLLAVNCPPNHADVVMDRLVGDLDQAGITASAAIVDLLPRAPSIVAPADAPAVISYTVCGLCRRKGAYVSPRFAVLRCKYCGGRHPLSEEEWRAALDGSR